MVIRNLADFPGQDAIESKKLSQFANIVAPKYFTSGMHLSSDKLKTIDDVSVVVRQHAERGYDYIKLRGNLDKSVYLALLDEAESIGIPVIGHAQRHLPLNFSLRMHELSHVEELAAIALQSRIEGKTADMVDIEKIVLQVKDSGIVIIPSLSILAMISHYTDDNKFKALQQRNLTRLMAFEEFEWFTDMSNSSYQSPHFRTPFMKKHISDLYALSQMFTKKLSDAGVPLVSGSDNLGFHIAGYSMHDELEELVKAGLTPYESLKSATIVAARHLRLQGSFGTIEEGKKAEFVLLAQNPLVDIQNTRTIMGVMNKGRWFSQKDINTLLCEAADARRASWPEVQLAQIKPLSFCNSN